ncbi:MAG: pyrroline-5-carboxylate reductase [bacterium]|nr:pyrroline-5-carboxylate reductase [bacterium]
MSTGTMSAGHKLGFIGAGTMAEALIKGIIAAGITAPENILATDINLERLSWLRAEYGIRTEAPNARAAEHADVLLLCVKPQILPLVLRELGMVVTADQLVISIAAGMALPHLERAFDTAVPLVRAMPNTPALVQRGVTALAAGTHANAQHMHIAHELFRGVGSVVEVPEELMDTVTAVSGSGPAYVFFLMEAMRDAALQHGLSDELATHLVVETVRGAGELIAHTHELPHALRQRVTSPGGTTEAAVNVLQTCGVHAALVAAIEAAIARSRALAQGT